MACARDPRVAEQLGVSRCGLDAGEAERRLRRYGANFVEETAPRSRLCVLADQFADLPALLLHASSGLAGLGRDFIGAGAILASVALDSALSYEVECKNENLLASWRQLEAGQARVLRRTRPRKSTPLVSGSGRRRCC